MEYTPTNGTMRDLAVTFIPIVWSGLVSVAALVAHDPDICMVPSRRHPAWMIVKILLLSFALAPECIQACKAIEKILASGTFFPGYWG
ncbi:hypothetical protein VZT92_020246 [Zoarces viviparus]|uniref:Uncharacterized protein n=1 Tax=Zoarces viviparus TaxID=48416 RepID=A0AAW1EDW2_ZOAVI